MQHDRHQAVARAADYPTIHQDLTARHTWLRRWWQRSTRSGLSSDPEFFDARAAELVRVWGISLWIGGGWCESEWDAIKITRDDRKGADLRVRRRSIRPTATRSPGLFRQVRDGLSG